MRCFGVLLGRVDPCLPLSPMAKSSAFAQFPPCLPGEVQRARLSSAHVAELRILPGDSTMAITCALRPVR